MDVLKTIQPSEKFDWDSVAKWLKNALIFSSPALIVFLTSLSNGDDFQIAVKLLYVAGINALIDFLRKYKGKKNSPLTPSSKIYKLTLIRIKDKLLMKIL